MKPVAYFVRHGDTDLNDSNSFRGPLDPSLNENGLKQADRLGDFFSGRDFSAVYRSTKKRTKQTLDRVLKDKKQKINDTHSFDALNVGDLAGKPKSEENLEFLRHFQENTNEKIPGGESIDEFRQRSDPKIMSVITHGDEAGKPTLSVVHSSIIHEISHLLHGDHQKVKVRPGGVVGVFKTPDGNYVAKALLKKSRNQQDKEIGS